ncbi:MAG: YicC family protein [Bacteroidetes bacterium]|nr:YicC family protein [Bacteroidota bacterium]
MTGYGVGRATNNQWQITAELKSLNSRTAEVYLRLPHQYFQQEILLKNHLAARLDRGKISMTLTVDTQSPELNLSKVKIDFDLVKAYYAELNTLQKELALTDTVPLSTILSLPGVVAEQQTAISEEEWTLVMQAVEQATEALIGERRKEGLALCNDLDGRVQKIAQMASEIPPLAEVRVQNIRQRLTQSFGEMQDSLSMSPERLQQELIYYLEKYDINEEQVRLAAHLENFRQTLKEAPGQGRKLLFIVQEMWREVNTLGVKSYDIQIQSLVVQMKDELEKMKEQLMNIL